MVLGRLVPLTILLTAGFAAPAIAQGVPPTGSLAAGSITSRAPVALLPAPWEPGIDTLSFILPVLDDAGNPIAESEIRRKMRRFGARWWMQPPAFLLGALIGAVVSQPRSQDACSIYDPCSDREKFLERSAPIFGGAMGLLLINASFPGVDRIKAVEKIRAERRGARRAPATAGLGPRDSAIAGGDR